MQRTNSAFFTPFLLVALSGLGISLASAAAAEEPGAENLAPPGVCAEPRDAVGAADAGARISIVGPVSALFNPLNVAAPPSIAGQSPPTASAVVSRGPCDVPGAGCRGAIAASNPPIVPGGRPGPSGQ